VVSDTTSSTEAPAAHPALELTVGVRDGGSPSKSAVSRLTLVLDDLAAVPDIDPVVIPSSTSSSFGGLTWIQRLFVFIGAALVAAVLAAVVFTVVVRTVAVFFSLGPPAISFHLIYGTVQIVCYELITNIGLPTEKLQKEPR